ncbi:MAG: hypothetical protein U1E45_22200 [Geminicoccaceae bacterium]
MPDRILTAMYDNQRSAETAREELIGLSVSPTDISVRHSEGEADTASDSSESGGFWSSLKDLFVPDEDRRAYAEGLSRGEYLLTVRVDENLVDEADEIFDVLERYEPIDLDERGEQWQREAPIGAESDSVSSDAVPAHGPATASATLADDGSTSRPLVATDASGTDNAVTGTEDQRSADARQVGSSKRRVRSYVPGRPPS